MSKAQNSVKYGLAPMEGVTDFATRLWFQLIGGLDFTWTPFLRVTDTFPNKLPEAFAPELFALKGLMPAPLKFQVMGSRPEDIVRTSDLLGDRVDGLDLNCGCPSPTVVGSRAGSSLLEHADFFGHFIEHIVQRVGPNRLSVKMRTGYNHAQEFPALLTAISDLKIKHLTVHGRTRPDRYLGQADWTLIRHAQEKTSFEIIGSGDITDDYSKANKIFVAPQVQTAIIGRGALRNPWIFDGAKSAPIVSAFVAFVLMQDWGVESHESLVQWASHDSHLRFGRLTTDDWQKIVLSICAKKQPAMSVDDIQVSQRALSRGKMLWNYLRSSLPEAFMEPTLMRSRSLPEMVKGIDKIAFGLGFSDGNLPLSYRKDLDWMYSGAGRGESKPSQRID